MSELNKPNNNQKDEKTAHSVQPIILGESAKFQPSSSFRKLHARPNPPKNVTVVEEDFDWSKIHGEDIMKWQTTGAV